MSEANRAALHAMDSAIFCVSLTHGAPSSLHDVQRNALHGGGADRWLDKSFQLVVTENAKAAVRFAHLSRNRALPAPLWPPAAAMDRNASTGIPAHSIQRTEHVDAYYHLAQKVP